MSNAPVPKVVASTGGGGLGYAVQIISVYLIEKLGSTDIPAEVENATGFILVVLFGFIAGYFAPREKAAPEPLEGPPEHWNG